MEAIKKRAEYETELSVMEARPTKLQFDTATLLTLNVAAGEFVGAKIIGAAADTPRVHENEIPDRFATVLTVSKANIGGAVVAELRVAMKLVMLMLEKKTFGTEETMKLP